MSLSLLFKDEMKGFYKSKVMLVLWFGLPLISILMHFFQADAEGIPYSYLVGLIVASLGGLLSAVMLSTTIVSERNNHVYDLFLVRPVKRRDILLAKYFAVILCLLIATSLSLIAGFIIDAFTLEIPMNTLLRETFESILTSIAAMSIACSMGILIGLFVNSVPVAAILSIYLGNQLSMMALIPSLISENIDPLWFAVVVGTSVSVGVLWLSVRIFNKKQI